MSLTGSFFWYALPFFIAAVAIEFVVLWRRGRAYSWREALASVTLGFGYKLTGLAAAAGVLWIWMLAWDHRVATLPMDQWWTWPVIFVAVEFAYYWFHRWSHEIRWMWASHAVHHSAEHLNVLAAFRLSWTAAISGGFLVYTPLMWLGIHPLTVSMMLGLNLLYQAWIHTDLIPKLGWLEYILNTPSNHRVHHASNADYLDKNYGGVLIVFDRVFGTYVAERGDDPCKYGLVKPVESNNPVVIAFHEWMRIARDVFNTESWRDIPGYLFNRPGWKPRGSAPVIAAPETTPAAAPLTP